MEVLNPIPAQVKKIIALVLIVLSVSVSCFVGFAEIDENIGSFMSFLPKSMLSVFDDMKLSHWELFTMTLDEEAMDSAAVIFVIMVAVVGSGVISGLQTWKGSKKAVVIFPVMAILSLGFDMIYVSALNDDMGFQFLELEGSPVIAAVFAAVSCVFSLAAAKDVAEGRAVEGGMSKEEMATMMQTAKEKAAVAATKAGQAASAAGAVAKEATAAATEAAKNAAKEQKEQKEQQQSANPSQSGGFCPHCGNALKADAAFCSGCGKSVK